MDIITVASYAIIAFVVIIIIGSIVGGKSFGGVIGGGILTIMIIAAIFIIIIGMVPKFLAEKDRESELLKENETQKMIERLSIEEKKSTDSNFLHFENKCDKKVSLYIRYLNTSEV